MSEETLATHLDELLSEARPDLAIDMSAADAAYLAEHSGVRDASDSDLAALDARSAGRVAAEAGRGLSRSEVAAMLTIDPSRVSHQVAAGNLYCYQGGQRRPTFPDWQFVTAAPGSKNLVLPHLSDVLAAIPIGSHPVSVRTFMTTPSTELVVDGVALAPREWLAMGGDPALVAELAASLGEQV